MSQPAEILPRRRHAEMCGAPGGYDALVVAELATSPPRPVLFIARDDTRLAELAETLTFFAPDLPRLSFPAWDCLPYDRISPNPEIVSRRLATLSRLAATDGRGAAPLIILTTVSAVVQRVPPRAAIAAAGIDLAPGSRFEPAALLRALTQRGYGRVDTVTEPGDLALRGGIVDVFPSGAPHPVRLDFFGDEIEAIRTFDSGSQRTVGRLDRVHIGPMSEVLLDDGAIGRFRSCYRTLFGAAAANDPLYESVSAGRRHPGCEHYLPLFYGHLESIFDYVGDPLIVLDHRTEHVRDERFEAIQDYYSARRDFDGSRFALAGTSCRPLPPDRLYLDAEDWARALDAHDVAALSPFAAAEGTAAHDAGGRPGLDFAEARANPDVNVFDALAARVAQYRKDGRRVAIAAVSRGSRERLTSVLREHGIPGVAAADRWEDVLAAPAGTLSLVVLGLERGFVAPGLAIITEQDILGERLVRRRPGRRRAETFLAEASALASGDLVVHVEHGIGRYEGLETIAVDGAPHDCLRIVYAGDAKLYLPVENIEMVSRYGAETDGVALDRLGGAAWQARRAKLKQRIREIAHELIGIAAARALRSAPAFEPPHGAYDEFCARFPYSETEDQARAIDDVLADLAAGRPADRLICGDVGFGKTEVALRAAFVSAMDGRQVAVVVPTTLLSRQHVRTFGQRFSGYPVRIAELSRLVSAKEAKRVKAGLADGTIDIVVGTHALLARDITFRDLGLLIVDEEQHFGVTHKERLKKLKADVHVLTLTATPIPRTLQMALSGVREMSLITTPPVDRLAVRTYVLEFDPVVIREAILRERHRGGQTFYVCPRIEDLEPVGNDLRALVPEVKIVVAHGRLSPRELEAAVGAFYAGACDVLLSTNIIESGLDLPSVNTIVVHRADMFGLAQLYQLRGRVGRGKVRAYAYLTLPPRQKLSAAAQKRLSVMQALDALGAGFTLASHDLDIRGAGNLLGDEQSGHIREVGIELYQQMLEDAVAEARGLPEAAAEMDWSPQLTIGISVLIPETFVPDLDVRLGLYRRLADLREEREIEAFAAELIDRFGPLPQEVENLLQVVAVKQLCRRAGIERIEAGPKGAVLAFHGQTFANPEGLVRLINKRVAAFKLRPDQRLVYKVAWDTPSARLRGIRALVTELARLAGQAPQR